MPLVGKRGAAIAIDPHTGDVIALAKHAGVRSNAFARAGLTPSNRGAGRTISTSVDQPRAAAPTARLDVKPFMPWRP